MGGVIPAALWLIAAGLAAQTVIFWRAHGLTYFRCWAVALVIAGQSGLAWAAWSLEMPRSAAASASPALLGVAILALKAV